MEPTDTKAESIISTRSSDEWDHDPANPRQWSTVKKWQAMILVSFYAFVAIAGSSMMAPAIPNIAMKYEITNTVILTMTFSIFFLSFALGPLFAGPLSEMYGRSWVLHIGNLVHLIFSLACAFAPNIGSLIAFRFMAGLAAAPAQAIMGGTITDLFTDRDRGAAMALSLTIPFTGAIVAPIAGGFVAHAIGPKYIFIIMAALCGLMALIAIPFLKETYTPVIIIRLRSSASVNQEKMAMAVKILHNDESLGRKLWLNLSRPVKLLTHSFTCFILSLYLAMVYGMNFLMVATFPLIFEGVYHFSGEIAGLAYIGPGIGYIFAAMFGMQISSKIYSTLADRNGGIGKPEMRIPTLIFGSLFTPIGLLWYGWSAEKGVHWIMPIIGAGIFAFGYVNTFVAIYLYLVDAFQYTASAISAVAVFQSLLGFAFPLFGQDMYVRIGYGGGNSLLAGLAIVIGIPFPIWIWYKGEGIRMRSKIFLNPEVL